MGNGREGNDKDLYDLIVLGGGPGGYPAAIKAAQSNKRIAVVEMGELGGTCLNRGCIPTKALIANADALRKVQAAKEFGIEVGEISFDYSKMSQRKDAIVDKIRGGLSTLIKSNDIDLIQGRGVFLSPTEIEVTGDQPRRLKAKAIVIATGSEPRQLPMLPIDGKRIHDSTSVLKLESLPSSIAIIGGGIIGCEFASLYANLGVEVTIIEALPSILANQCSSVVSYMTQSFQRKGMTIHTNTFVQSAEVGDAGVKLSIPDNRVIQADIVLVAVGRRRNTADIGLDRAGVHVDEKSGEIPTNERMETNVPGIYAVGDVTGNWWLAHVASHQGLVAGTNAIGGHAQMHYNAVPSVIFTDPEIATVGLTLGEAIDAGYTATVGSFPFEILGKSQAALHMEGFAQIVTDRVTGQILGAQVIGYEASTLVAEMGIAIANELTIDCVTETIHAHPTIPEAWMEAAMVANDTPLHMVAKKRKSDAR
ncbi:MAG: dihydrolipoyl dehydrogenase [Chlamydiia bacterium]|nr:dihydrolipoyl dehydrogenase [Chlamydiia bacterium]